MKWYSYLAAFLVAFTLSIPVALADKDNIGQYSTTAGNNTDADGVSIAENAPAGNLNDALREVMSHLAGWADDLEGVYTVSGTDTYTVSTSTVYTALTDIHGIVLTFTNANTGAATLNVDSIGAVAIKKNGGSALAAGDIPAGSTHLLVYDGTDFEIVGNIATATGISNIAEDTTPQLGGDLDGNAFDIQLDDADGIHDDSDNEQLIFQKTTSAVNEFEMTNAATGNAPQLAVTGDDTNIDVDVRSKGSGKFDFQTSDASTAAQLRLYDADNTNYQAIKPPDTVSSDTIYTLPGVTTTWPTSQGGADEVLTNNGSGVLSWAASDPGGFTVSTTAASSQASVTETGIPSTATMIVVSLHAASASGTGAWTMTIGDSGGLETTGYQSGIFHLDDAPTLNDWTSTSSFRLTILPNSADLVSGNIILTLVDSSNNTWAYQSTLSDDQGSLALWVASGSKSLSGTLDRVDFNPSGNFDAGTVSISYM